MRTCEFRIGSSFGLSDPRGQIGKELSTDMHMLTVSEKSILDLAYCIKRCDLELAGIASSHMHLAWPLWLRMSKSWISLH